MEHFFDTRQYFAIVEYLLIHHNILQSSFLYHGTFTDTAQYFAIVEHLPTQRDICLVIEHGFDDEKLIDFYARFDSDTKEWKPRPSRQEGILPLPIDFRSGEQSEEEQGVLAVESDDKVVLADGNLSPPRDILADGND